MCRIARGFLARQPGGQPLLLLRRQPGGAGGTVGEIEPRHHTEHDGRNALQDEQPLPALEAADAVKAEQVARDRRADHGRDRHRDGERGEDAGAILGRIPVGEIEDDAGKEPRFRHAEQETQHVETGGAADQRHQRRDDAPGNHDARDPAAGADLVQDDVAGHLEQEITNEEDARPPAEHQRRELEFSVHGQSGEAEIDAVEIGEEVGQDQKRNDPP